MPVVDCAPRQRCGTCGKFLERGKGCPTHDSGLESVQIQLDLELRKIARIPTPRQIAHYLETA